MDSTSDNQQADILKKVQQLSYQIWQLQDKQNRREATSYGAAMGLQELKKKRQILMAQLDKPTKVTEDGQTL